MTYFSMQNVLMEQLPRLKKAMLIEKVSIAVDEPFKAEWIQAKERGIDVAEWARRILKREIPNLKAEHDQIA